MMGSENYILSDGTVIFCDGPGPFPSLEEMEERHRKEKARDGARDPRTIEFGKNLRQARLAQNIILGDLSDYLGISSASLCDIERGRRFPTEREALMIGAKFPDIDLCFEATQCK